MISGRFGFLAKAILGLGILWALVWGIMSLAGVFEVTPEKITAYIDEKPFAGLQDPEERRRRLEKIAEMVNQLGFDQRQTFRESEEGAAEREEGRPNFFDDLNRDERVYFVEATMSTAFRQMMKAFNEMEREERKKFVERARKDVAENAADQRRMERLEAEDEEIYNRIVEEGLRAYYQDASAETKLDLAPLMEEMQRQMRRPGGRPHRGQ